ncbi:DNA cytosine methyltransferase [Serratia marcescens]|uniref:Cytosine-specific methyltransferase n=1 Tax=Serratia marcescens TaxID=615 RepID=A0ABD5ICE9_SERMA|nr:DNA cytosine methyltransferase [Serratia marcescens]MDX7081666.1 DNA cytosine methyltransferase [Serratia marcescens]
MNKKLNIIDLFSGCGGFGLGAELSGFNTYAAIDIDTDLQSAYKRNFPNTQVINGDLSLFSKSTWELILGGNEIDGVIGGPPCQGFSRMGKKLKDDPRNSLVYHFYRHVDIIRPKFFIMENVEGILDKGSRESLFSAIELVNKNYIVIGPIIIDASNYGAPTIRKRVIVIGYRQDCTEKLEIKDFSPPSNKSKVFVKDAISDLPSPISQIKESDNYGWTNYPKRIKKPLSKYAKKMRKSAPNGLGWNVSNDHLKNKIISGNFDTSHTQSVIERYSAVQQGHVDEVSRFHRLNWNGLCPTLRAGTGSDKGSFQAARPIHPDEPRVITVREAARLQGFPDWFTFHNTKWHSFRMIGNSVSPIVSEYILSVIKTKLYVEHSAESTLNL